MLPGPVSLDGSATVGIRARRQPTRDGNPCFQNNKLKLDSRTTKVVGKSLGSPRTSLGRKALGNLMGINQVAYFVWLTSSTLLFSI